MPAYHCIPSSPSSESPSCPGFAGLVSTCLVEPCLSAEPFSVTPLTQSSVRFIWEPAVCSPKETLLLVSHTHTASFKFLFLASLVQWLQGSELAHSWGPYKVCWLSLAWWFSVFPTVRFLSAWFITGILKCASLVWKSFFIFFF